MYIFSNLEEEVIVSGGLFPLSPVLQVLVRSQPVLLHCGDLPHLPQPGSEVLQSGGRVEELLLRVSQVLLGNIIYISHSAALSLLIGPD